MLPLALSSVSCEAGRERCYRVQWELPQPELVEGEEDLSEEALIEACVRKDANEVLIKNGPEALRLCIDQAEPLPIRGLFRWALPSLLFFIRLLLFNLWGLK